MPCPQSGLLFSACPIPATTPVSRKGQGSMALRKKSLNFCCGERGTASGLVVVLNVAMTPITRCFSCCLSCSSAFSRSVFGGVDWRGDCGGEAADEEDCGSDSS